MPGSNHLSLSFSSTLCPIASFAGYMPALNPEIPNLRSFSNGFPTLQVLLNIPCQLPLFLSPKSLEVKTEKGKRRPSTASARQIVEYNLVGEQAIFILIHWVRRFLLTPVLSYRLRRFSACPVCRSGSACRNSAADSPVRVGATHAPKTDLGYNASN